MHLKKRYAQTIFLLSNRVMLLGGASAITMNVKKLCTPVDMEESTKIVKTIVVMNMVAVDMVVNNYP